jgi:hypothetical protein
MHMRKVLITVAVAAMALGGANAAIADPGNGAPFGPGSINPDHPAWYGLCTAHYNNSDQAKENGAPFRALDEHFDDGDQDAIDEFCSALRPSNGQGQGNQDGSSAPAPGPRGGR